MCTALIWTARDSYFGRNLDLEYSYGEEIVITPRRHRMLFRHLPSPQNSYAFIGTAYVPDGEPLYYDAVNEHGLAMAGLNFPQYARYAAPNGAVLAPFEVIPYVLSQCKSTYEACELLRRIPIAAVPYSDTLPVTPLHWLVADGEASAAVEPLADGVSVTADPVGVLTNSPPLSVHLSRLAEYTALSPHTPSDRFGDHHVTLYSRGMGTLGLPGDFSSVSRFVRAAYVKAHSDCDGSEAQSVMQTFHILDSVAHPRGSVRMPDGRAEITVYSSCCNLRTGMYYYKTYNGSHIQAVHLRAHDLDGEALCRYPMRDEFCV